MKKVTFCAYDKPGNVGGPPAWMQRLLPELRDRGIECRVLFLLHTGDTGPCLEFLLERGFACLAIPAPGSTEERIQWILEQVREDPPDVFVPNLVVAAYFAARWIREAGIPTIGILHSDDAFYRGLQDQFVFGRPSDRLSAMVCVSLELERQVVARGPASTRVERIGYGVPVPDAVRSQGAGPLRIAYVGRLVEEQKRISDVTRALCMTAREVPGVSAVIFGDGPDREAVERILLAEGAGLPVVSGGMLASQEVQSRLVDFDVIVLLSDYEGLPIALMEAMAVGCIPVCSRMQSGIPELVEDGITGVLVDDRGAGFVKAIRKLQSDPDFRNSLSTAARQCIVEAHSMSGCSDRWAGLIRGLSPAPTGRVRAVRRVARFKLPPVHPGLASADVRRVVVPLALRLYRKSRMFAGRIRRRMFNVKPAQG